MGGDEDDRRGLRQGPQRLRQRQAIGARHADVQQHGIEAVATQHFHGLGRIGLLAADLGRRQGATTQQGSQPGAGQRFVVDNQHLQRHDLLLGRPAVMREPRSAPGRHR